MVVKLLSDLLSDLLSNLLADTSASYLGGSGSHAPVHAFGRGHVVARVEKERTAKTVGEQFALIYERRAKPIALPG